MGLFSEKEREPSVAHKYNQLGKAAVGQVLVVWEDDDVYLPWHLQSIADAYLRGGDWFRSKQVYTTYGKKAGEVNQEKAEFSGGDWRFRFHGGWAYTSEVFNEAKGYPTDGAVSFDTLFGDRLAAVGETEYIPNPGYVYRTFNHGIYQASQHGAVKENYDKHIASLASLPAPHIGALVPKFDDWTEKLYESMKDKG